MGLAGLGGGLKNTGLGMLGIIEHAIIVFPNLPSQKIDLKSAKPSTGIAGFTNSINTLDCAKIALASGVANTGILSESQASNLFSTQLTGNAFTVQFNPASITYSAYSGDGLVVNAFNAKGEAGKAESGVDNKCRIDVSFRIYFDDTNNRDAFANDKGNLDMTSIAKDVGTVALKAMGKEYSVRPQVEAFHAAMRVTNGIITFNWGKTSLAGQLTSINTTYTMFNPQGEPIRAYGDVTLTCTADVFAGYAEKFQNQFNNLFSSTSEVTTTQGLTNQFGKMIKL